MTESPYTNREIEEKFDEICKSLDRIEQRVIIQNGRVSQNEKWRYMTTGAIGVLGLIIVPILGWALWTLATIV